MQRTGGDCAILTLQGYVARLLRIPGKAVLPVHTVGVLASL